MAISPIRWQGDIGFCTRCGIVLYDNGEGGVDIHDGEEGRPSCYPTPKAEITPEQYGRLRRALDTIGDIQVSVLKDKGAESQWRRLYNIRGELGQYLSDNHGKLSLSEQLEQIRCYQNGESA